MTVTLYLNYDVLLSSPRLAVKAVLEKLTYSSYVTTSRALIEKDRIIFGLLLGTEVGDVRYHALFNQYIL